MRFARKLLALGVVAGCVGFSPGCSQQTGSAAEPLDSGPPFQASARAGRSPIASIVPAGIPAGTAMVIRLAAALSSASSRVGDSFAAVLDDPIIIGGQIFAPKGTAVTGRVIAARASRRLGDPGYLRLTLIALSLHGQSIPLEASSVFAKWTRPAIPHHASVGKTEAASQNAYNRADQKDHPGNGLEDVQFAAQQRITFRLTNLLAIPG
jgi:hypothetical protein